MSELPDDLRRWPSDPFKLLGVSRNVAPRELKRAYTRLIRSYKPEHAPEEFRRIRQAYDSVRRVIELYGTHEHTAPSKDSTADESATAQSVADEDSGGRPHPASPRQKSLDEKLVECWQWAVDGDEHKTYRALEQLQAQAPHESRIGARLYWLVTLAGPIGDRRAPCDWLVAGLRRNGFVGPLRELYRRELAANPDEALSQRCSELIDTVAASRGLGDLLELRWSALSATDRADQAAELICADLGTLRERFLAYDDEAWASLVFSAVDRSAFSDAATAKDLLTRCERDLQGMSHLHLRLTGLFDRYDLAHELASCARKLLQQSGPWHAAFVDVVRETWLSPIEKSRSKIIAYLATIASWPGQMLQNFDAIQRAASPMLFQFRRTLDALDSVTEPPDDVRAASEIEQLVLSFARDTPATKYSDWRPQLLDFCLREVVMPEQVAEALSGIRDYQISADRHLSQSLSADVPLACVCHACRLFWNN